MSDRVWVSIDVIRDGSDFKTLRRRVPAAWCASFEVMQDNVGPDVRRVFERRYPDSVWSVIVYREGDRA